MSAPSRIDEIRARLEKATPGPWTVVANSSGGATLVRGGGDWKAHEQTHLQIVPKCDAEFIAHSRADVEYLLAEIARLQQELEHEQIRLAACTAAALGNTPETVAQRITRESPYWSASYGDVCAAVDREMALQSSHAALLETLKKITEIAETMPHVDRMVAIRQLAEQAETPR